MKDEKQAPEEKGENGDELTETAQELLKEQARSITPDDLSRILTKEEELRRKFESVGPFGRFLEDCKLLISLIRDYSDGTYRKVPFWTVAAAGAAFIYIINPLDLIPDPIPLMGQMDDLVVFGACMLMIEQELHIYKKWKLENAREEDGHQQSE